MKKKTVILLGLYTGLFLLITRVRRVIQGIGFKVADVSFSPSGEDGTSILNLDLYLNNPSLFSVTFDAIRGDVYIQGRKCAELNQVLNIPIRAQSVTAIRLQATVIWGQIADAIKQNILSGDVRTLSFQFIGSITSEGHEIPVNKYMNYYDLTA